MSCCWRDGRTHNRVGGGGSSAVLAAAQEVHGALLVRAIFEEGWLLGVVFPASGVGSPSQPFECGLLSYIHSRGA
jgi:hypothetical protein